MADASRPAGTEAAGQLGTEELRAVDAHQPAALYRLLVGSLRDYAVFALDASGYVLTWNPGAERFKGYKAHEIIGKHFSVFYPQAQIDARLPQRELKIVEAEGRFEDEGWRVRKNGTCFWANVVITALRDRSGKLVGFAKVTRDLTERRELQMRAIEDARRIAEAEASNRAKVEFLAAMSHELRTPLNGIGGYVDLILLGISGPVTERQIKNLNRIRRSQQHLLGIVNDLLNFSSIEAGRLAYDLAHTPLREILAAVASVVGPLAAAKSITLTWPRRVRSGVYTDRAKAEQILLNLLTNAIKFTGDRGRVDVSCRVRREHTSIEVRDTGVGIAPDKLKSIFDPFVQVGRTLTSAHEGTGLGLAIGRDLAHAMSGDLLVESVPGSGSTFTLVLPREPSATVPSRTLEGP